MSNIKYITTIYNIFLYFKKKKKDFKMMHSKLFNISKKNNESD